MVGSIFCLAILFLATSVQAAGIKVQNVNYDQELGVLVVKGKIEGLGDNVDVFVENLSTGAVLASSTTSKQFSYMVPMASFADVPCEVLILAGAESAIASVRHGPGDCTRFELTLSGVVRDGPVPFATVSVTLDGVTYTTTADEFGNYELPILTANINQLVRIDASAEDPETGGSIEFINLIGSFSRVLNAGPSGNVTNLTTASYILAVEANGGSEPTTIEELQTAETAIDVTELFELAALIKLIVDDPSYSLPAGEDSMIAFISDPAAVEAYLETVPQEDLDAALAEILSDSDLVAGFTIADIPERYYAIPTASPGFMARRGDALEFNVGVPGAETGTILSFSFTGQGTDQSFDWSIDASGRLVLDFNTPIEQIDFPGIDSTPATPPERQLLVDANIQQIAEIRTVTQHTYTRVTDGTLVDIVRREAPATITYPPIDLGGGATLTLANQPVFEITSTEQTLRSSLDIDPTPFKASCAGGGQGVCVEGAWAGTYHYFPGVDNGNNPYPDTAYGDIASFAADSTVSGNISGFAATWSVDADGALVITYPDGWTQRALILDSLGLEYGVFLDFSNGFDRFATYTVFVRADESFDLTVPFLTSPAGQYWNGEINSWVPGSFDENGLHTINVRFGWQFDATGGTGRNRRGFPDECGKGLLTTAMTWSVNPDGSALIDRFPTVVFPGWALRTWFPVAETTTNGDRLLYVMETESRLIGPDNMEYGLFIPPRLNIEREIDEFTDYNCFFNQ